MTDQTISYKTMEAMLIASIKVHVEKREELLPVFDHLRLLCKDNICGPEMAIIHGGAAQSGLIVEVAFPVHQSVIADEVQSYSLESARVLSMIHNGPHQTIRETVLKIYDYLDQHAWTTSLLRREIYLSLVPDAPEKNETEVQVVLHEWEQFLAQGVEQILGAEAKQKVMEGSEQINPESSGVMYREWIRGAMDRLDSLTDDPEKKYQIVSCCAHVFPEERITQLRAIYEKRRDIDDVLREMYRDDFWYEKPVRKGNVLHIRKNPFNPEGYTKATTPAERRKAYCHCSFVHPYLDEVPAKLSPTFCFCGAGWYKRLWEGVLGQPIKIQHIETLLKGNDQCILMIILPIEAEGELSSNNVAATE
jgi:effector-binding domain-containing protein